MPEQVPARQIVLTMGDLIGTEKVNAHCVERFKQSDAPIRLLRRHASVAGHIPAPAFGVSL